MKKKLIYSIIIMLTLILFIIVGYKNSINSTKYNFKNKVVTIKEGENFYKIIKKLNIKENLFIKIYVKFNQEKVNKIEAGYFKFNGKYSIRTIVDSFQQKSKGSIAVTIPEGFTMKQIRKRLVENDVITGEEFDKAVRELDNFYYYTPNGNLDGYLFPDTYYFSSGETGEEVISRFLNRFLEKFPPEKYPDKKYFYDRLILASIIEKEAGNKKEMPLVASVFQNRLNKGMRLQSCATVAYLFNYEKGTIYYKDLQINSPYNTYRNKGLPPGPISNPGEATIKASLKPAKTNYFYFVLGSNGLHHFSETYNEHMVIQNQDKRGVKK